MTAKARLISRLENIDWDFSGKPSESPFSAIHWYPGRFASQLPAAFIGLLSDPGELVLDPFMGSGTTIVEAQRLDRRSIGIDVNPIACIATKSKTIPASAKTIAKLIQAVKREMTTNFGDPSFSTGSSATADSISQRVQLQKWYSTAVQRDLIALWHFITTFRGIKRTLMEGTFSAILLSVCNETRHWGYICDNSTPKTTTTADVVRHCFATLDRLANAYDERDAERIARLENDDGSLREAEVVCNDATLSLAQMESDSVDLVVTSPPYFGVTDYVKAQRLSMEWFGHDIEPLRLKEIGARSKRHRTSAHEDYLGELQKILVEIRRVLKRGRFCAVVIGQSSTRDLVLGPVRDMIRDCRFSLDVDLNRTVSSQRRQMPSIKGEHIFVMSK